MTRMTRVSRVTWVSTVTRMTWVTWMTRITRMTRLQAEWTWILYFLLFKKTVPKRCQLSLTYDIM